VSPGELVRPESCPKCGSVDLVELAPGPAWQCNDCEQQLAGRQVLTAAEVYNRCAEYYALGLDQAQLETKRKKLKAEVEQALGDWSSAKFESEGFKAGHHAGRKKIDYKGLAIKLSSPERVKELEPEFTTVGQPYFQIDGPKV